MDLSKSYEFVKPEDAKSRIHIIGCGSVGSTLAENLARFGFSRITLYDFDFVEPHNLANQMFTASDIGKPKVEAVKNLILSINPEAEPELRAEKEGYVNQKLFGYVFLCVDNIELRRKIATDNKYNNNILAMFDIRTRLTDAQAYAANWSDYKQIKSFIESTQFSHEEAEKETPMSACHVTLSVCPTIRIIVGYQVSNFVNFMKKEQNLKRMIIADAFNMNIIAV